MKQKFLEELLGLLGSMNEFERAKAVQFYSEYIDDMKENGKTEQEAVQSLGTPQAVAQRILSERAEQPHQAAVKPAQTKAEPKPQSTTAKVLKIILWATAFIWIWVVFGLGIAFISLIFSLTVAYFAVMVSFLTAPLTFIVSLFFGMSSFSYGVWMFGCAVLLFGIGLAMIPFTKAIFEHCKKALLWIGQQFKKLSGGNK